MTGAPEDSAASGSASLQKTAEELMPLLYGELRRQARIARLRVGADQTLQTTALIHEAFLRLQRSPPFNDRVHFLRAAALAMRQVLVNYARDSIAVKRGGGATHVPLDLVEEIQPGTVGMQDEATVLSIHAALDELAVLHPRLAEVVECRFFAGYTEQETGEALGLTDRTVRREWVKARAWLRERLGMP